MKILGLRFVEGEYQGNKYSNVYVYCDDTKNNDFGVCTQSFKIKRSYLDVLCANLGIQYGQLLDRSVGQIYYDRYGNIIEFNLE